MLYDELKEQLTKARADNERMKAALQIMVQVEECHCGCEGMIPILMRPPEYYVIAKLALNEM